MKKTIFAVVLLVAGYSLCAQKTVVYQSTSSNSTYSTPEPIKVNFQTYYPEATVVTWEPSGEWWRATYKGDNRITHVYYNTTTYYLEHPSNANFKVALPVINTYVPDGVVTSAINSYGNNLYSITTMKAADGTEIYQVSTLENGNLKNVWMNGESTVYTDMDKIRVSSNQKTDKF